MEPAKKKYTAVVALKELFNVDTNSFIKAVQNLSVL